MGRLGSTMDYYTEDKERWEKSMAELGLTFEQMRRYEATRRNLEDQKAKLTLPNLRTPDRTSSEAAVISETAKLQKWHQVGAAQKSKLKPRTVTQSAPVIQETRVLNAPARTLPEIIPQAGASPVQETPKKPQSTNPLQLAVILIAAALIVLFIIKRRK